MSSLMLEVSLQYPRSATHPLPHLASQGAFPFPLPVTHATLFALFVVHAYSYDYGSLAASPSCNPMAMR